MKLMDLNRNIIIQALLCVLILGTSASCKVLSHSKKVKVTSKPSVQAEPITSVQLQFADAEYNNKPKDSSKFQLIGEVIETITKNAMNGGTKQANEKYEDKVQKHLEDKIKGEIITTFSEFTDKKLEHKPIITLFKPKNDIDDAEIEDEPIEEVFKLSEMRSDPLWIVRFSSQFRDTTLSKEVRMWLGTPYRRGGSSKNGTDCSGFVKNIYKNVYGLDLSHSSRDMYKEVCPVHKQELAEGDLVFFKTRGKRISHVGVYIKDNKFVHSSSRNGVIISSLDEKYYKKRYFAGGRVVSRKSISMNTQN